MQEREELVLPAGATLEDFHSQLREECEELIEISERLERIRNGTWPAPMTEDAAYEALVAEMAHMVIALRYLMQAEGISREFLNHQCEYEYQLWLKKYGNKEGMHNEKE